jgi:hypothetical protein
MYGLVSNLSFSGTKLNNTNRKSSSIRGIKEI